GTALPWFTGETTAGMVETIQERIEPILVGKSISEAFADLDSFIHSFTHSPGATSAAEIALLDIRAKREDITLQQVFGPRFRTAITEVYPIPGLKPEKAVKITNNAIEEGYERFKIKATGEVKTDINRINSVLDVLPEHANLRIDANTAWETAPQTIDIISSITNHDQIQYIEQPTNPDIRSALRKIWEETGIPVYADETVQSINDIETLGHDATVKGVCLKLAKFGSPTKLYRAGRRANDLGLNVTIVSAFGTSLEAAVNLHLASALPNLSAGQEIAPMFLETDPTIPQLSAKPRMETIDERGIGVALQQELFK
ncbi:MAG: mandelate racemase/muconate lactonizing enzyme family protein, partial [Halobacteriaceae archaeon]